MVNYKTTTSDRDSLKEHADSLLKYDLASNRNPLRAFDQMELDTIFTVNGRTICLDYKDVRKTVDSLNIHFRYPEETQRTKYWEFYRVMLHLNRYLRLYEELHLKHRENTSLVIVNYMSWVKSLEDDKVPHDIFIRCIGPVFTFALFFLFERKVTDRAAWRNLYLNVKDTNFMVQALAWLQPELLRYFLKHICSKYGSNEDILGRVDLEFIMKNGKIDQFKVILEFTSCASIINAYIRHTGFTPIQIEISRFMCCSQQRLKLLCLAGRAVFHMTQNPSLRNSLVQILQLCFKTVPQACITWLEMYYLYRFLYFQIPPEPRDALVNKFREICEVYQKNFYVPIRVPKSLMSYARIAVRELYTADAADELLIPETLKYYLKFREP